MNYFSMLKYRHSWSRPEGKWCAQGGCETLDEAEQLVARRKGVGGVVDSKILTRDQYKQHLYGGEK